MILVDTSVWVDHLRFGDPALGKLLEHGEVLGHRFVIGELALGSLRDRDTLLAELLALPAAIVASDEEVLHLIDRQPLFGVGIGYIDAHLLASVRLMPGSRLWSRDRRLAIQLNLAAPLP